jgi:predicted dehydrogenase
VVVNYQRRFDCAYERLRRRIGSSDETPLLAANAFYIKGLLHIGTTMIDTITAVCGYPERIWAFNRVWNREIRAYTYEFILFYPHYNISVKTIDSNRDLYNYHIFELDFLLRDGRITLTDCTRYIETRSVCGFAYSGVNVINDGEPNRERTEFDQSMSNAIDYLYSITTGKQTHTINRPELSYNNSLILETVIQSYQSGRQVRIKESEWMS